MKQTATSESGQVRLIVRRNLFQSITIGHQYPGSGNEALVNPVVVNYRQTSGSGNVKLVHNRIHLLV